MWVALSWQIEVMGAVPNLCQNRQNLLCFDLNISLSNVLSWSDKANGDGLHMKRTFLGFPPFKALYSILPSHFLGHTFIDSWQSLPFSVLPCSSRTNEHIHTETYWWTTQIEVQYLAQRHIDMQMEIKPSIFLLGDNKLHPLSDSPPPTCYNWMSNTKKTMQTIVKPIRGQHCNNSVKTINIK